MAIAKSLEAIALHPARPDGHVAEILKECNAEQGEDNEDEEKDDAGQKEIGRFHDLHGGGGQRVEQRCRMSTRSNLIPGGQSLQETNADDAHGPDKILRPGLHDGWERHGAQADDGDGLEVGEERQGIEGDVRRRIGMPQTGYQSGGDQTQTCHDGCSPAHAGLIDRLTIRESRTHTGQADVQVIGRGGVDGDGGIEVGDSIGNARYPAGDGLGDILVGGLEGGLDVGERTQLVDIEGAWIQGLAEEGVAIGGGLDFQLDIAGDGGISDDIEGQAVVVGGEDDVEETGREAGVALADLEGRRLDDPLSGDDGR
ncbi:hypothetical protein B7463_g11659, partial [Scytalidium lignicola]